MSTRETSRNIDHAAAEWAARLDHAPLNAREEEQLDAWLQGDVRRPGALMRAQAVLVRNGRSRENAVSAQPRRASLHVLPQPEPRPAAARSRWTGLGGALAASLLVGVLAFLLVDAPKAYATAKGEIRTLPLPGGSSVTLNTDTRIKVHDDDGHPRIEVLRGEVFVQAVSEAKHPIVVEVEGHKLQATQAAFNVSRLESAPWQVIVRDGQVELEARADAPATLVAANMRLSGEQAAPRQIPLPSQEVERRLAWRDGKLAFHGETLADAAKAFARYSDTRIVIADPALAKEHVIGLYAANNPVGFARAASKLLDTNFEQSGTQVIISPKN